MLDFQGAVKYTSKQWEMLSSRHQSTDGLTANKCLLLMKFWKIVNPSVCLFTPTDIMIVFGNQSFIVDVVALSADVWIVSF